MKLQNLRMHNMALQSLVHILVVLLKMHLWHLVYAMQHEALVSYSKQHWSHAASSIGVIQQAKFGVMQQAALV